MSKNALYHGRLYKQIQAQHSIQIIARMQKERERERSRLGHTCEPKVGYCCFILLLLLLMAAIIDVVVVITQQFIIDLVIFLCIHLVYGVYLVVVCAPLELWFVRLLTRSRLPSVTSWSTLCIGYLLCAINNNIGVMPLLPLK